MVSLNRSLTDKISQDQLDLQDWLSHLPIRFSEAELDKLRTAWAMAREAYQDVSRLSGGAYFSHALGVATIMAELNLDTDTIVAALLHDLPAFERYDREQVSAAVGTHVADLLEGLSRMNLLHQLPALGEVRDAGHHAEALRKMLLAMASDVRVVFIALAERLDDLRDAKNRPPAFQRHLAAETHEIFAPLANRLGLWQMKWELEDLSFRYRDPETYKRIAKLLTERRVDRENFIAEVIASINDALDRAGTSAEVTGRSKHIYSIWRKMKRKGLDFHDLYDIRAVRILVDDVPTCYAVLGIVHSLWRHVPKEFDDYIATPKDNNYQSLHTAVVGPEGKALEVQIRTFDMHRQAELGIAAHWRYKEGGQQDRGFEKKIAWLRQLLEWGEEERGAEDFIDRFKGEVFEDRVYVLSPKGDIVDLPRGATPVDFAYNIHSDIGHRCRGAKVNGRIVPLTYPLQNGDQVEILTVKHGAPSRDWLTPAQGYVATGRARSKIRAYFRQQDQTKTIAEGRVILDRELHRLGLADVKLEQLAKRSRFPKMDDFLAAIGRNDISSGQIASLLSDHILPKREADTLLPTRRRRKAGPAGESEVRIYGVGNLLTRMAKCCRPVPGDEILGFITRGQGVTIHRRDCANMRHYLDDADHRLVEVSWAAQGLRRYPVEMLIEAFDRQGLIRDISAILSNEKINVIGINTRTDALDHQARMAVTMEIDDVAQLSRVMERIAGLRNVLDVRRKT